MQGVQTAALKKHYTVLNKIAVKLQKKNVPRAQISAIFDRIHLIDEIKIRPSLEVNQNSDLTIIGTTHGNDLRSVFNQQSPKNDKLLSEQSIATGMNAVVSVSMVLGSISEVVVGAFPVNNITGSTIQDHCEICTLAEACAGGNVDACVYDAATPNVSYINSKVTDGDQRVPKQSNIKTWGPNMISGNRGVRVFYITDFVHLIKVILSVLT